MDADPVRRVPVEGQGGFHRVSLDEDAVLFEAGAVYAFGVSNRPGSLPL